MLHVGDQSCKTVTETVSRLLMLEYSVHSTVAAAVSQRRRCLSACDRVLAEHVFVTDSWFSLLSYAEYISVSVFYCFVLGQLNIIREYSLDYVVNIKICLIWNVLPGIGITQVR